MSTRRLAEAVVAARAPLDETQQRLAIALYRLLAEGRPVSPRRLAEHAGVDPGDVERLCGRLPGAHRDDGGAVEGFWGLALSGTPHRLHVNGKTLHAWCAWDTLFLPALIGATVGVESSCPSTGAPIALTVTAGGVTRVTPEGTVLSFVLPDERFDADTVQSFCRYVHFFASDAAATAWTARHEGTFVLSIDEASEIARHVNETTYGRTLQRAESGPEVTLRADDPLAAAVSEAIHTGDTARLGCLLAEHPELATARIVSPDGCGDIRTLLHVATDWPGHFPNGAATVAALIDAGAAVNSRFIGRHTETPLHWAASSDDIAVLDALLDAGADIEAAGAVIAGGTPLSDAVAFGQWNAARHLVKRGARTTLWQAAALGLIEHVEQAFADQQPPASQDVTNAFWCACHGGQILTAQYLLDRGADRDWIGHDGLTPLDAAHRSGAGTLVDILRRRGAHSAQELDPGGRGDQTV